MGFEYGAGTEATYADYDGWIDGYRLRVIAPARSWYPDRYTLTVGFVGDFTRANAFGRMHRLGNPNYVQALAEKKLRQTQRASMEFDWFDSVSYVRAGFDYKSPRAPAVDAFTIEEISRLSKGPEFGWAATASRRLDQGGHLRAGTFFSDLPLQMFAYGGSQVLLNGDLYTLGRRIGPMVQISPLKRLDVVFTVTDRLSDTPGTRYRAQVVVRYKPADLANRLLHR